MWNQVASCHVLFSGAQSLSPLSSWRGQSCWLYQRRASQLHGAPMMDLMRQIFFGSVDVLWIILDHGFKMVQTKKKEHQYIQTIWEVLVMLNFFGSLIPGCGEYLNLSTSRTMGRDGHPREPNRTCRRPSCSPSHWLSEKSCCVRSRPIYTNIHEDR